MTNHSATGDKLQKIQVGNVPEGTTEEELRALFLAHGPVASYERPLDAHTLKAGASVYVEMAPNEAAIAIKALNGHLMADKKLSVSAAVPTPSWAPSADRSPTSPRPRRIVTDASNGVVADVGSPDARP